MWSDEDIRMGLAGYMRRYTFERPNQGLAMNGRSPYLDFNIGAVVNNLEEEDLVTKGSLAGHFSDDITVR